MALRKIYDLVTSRKKAARNVRAEAPMLLPLLSPREQDKAYRRGHLFTPVVAAGLLHVRPGVARALWGNPFECREVPMDMAWILAAVECSPPDWLPPHGDVAGWRRVRNSVSVMVADRILSGASKGSRSCQQPVCNPGSAVMPLLAGLIRRAGRDWTSVYNPAADLRMQTDDTVRELAYDLLAALVTGGLLPGEAKVSMNSMLAMAASLLHHPRHPRGVARIVAAHHHRLVPVADNVHDCSPGLQSSDWTPLLQISSWHHGDIEVVELCSRTQLQQEGDAMAHCVGSYGGTCVMGRGRILSLRDAQGHRISTLMVGLDERRQVVMVQHSAHANNLPPACARAAASAFVQACCMQPGLASTDVLLAPQRMGGADDVACLVGQHLAVGLGQGWNRPDIMAARWERWRALLDVSTNALDAIHAHFRRWPWPIQEPHLASALNALASPELASPAASPPAI